MRIVWRLKECAAREVYTEAGEQHGWSVSTVKTMLRRLVEKGYLKAKPVGNSFLYRPAKSALASLTKAADTLLDNTLEGTTGPLLAHMVKKSDLTGAEVAELRALLDQHESDTEDKQAQEE